MACQIRYIPFICITDSFLPMRVHRNVPSICTDRDQTIQRSAALRQDLYLEKSDTAHVTALSMFWKPQLLNFGLLHSFCAAPAPCCLYEQDMLMLHHCDRMLAEGSQDARLPLVQDWRKYKLASQADTGTRSLQHCPCKAASSAGMLTVLLPSNGPESFW